MTSVVERRVTQSTGPGGRSTGAGVGGQWMEGSRSGKGSSVGSGHGPGGVWGRSGAGCTLKAAAAAVGKVCLRPWLCQQ